jgi:hypothetical protein
MNASISRVSRPTRIAARLRETSGQPATPPVRPSTSGSRLLQAGARRPLATFLLLGFSLAYALAFLWGLAYHGVILGGGLAAALHVAPDELTGGALVLSLFPAALFVTWARNGRLGVRRLFRRAFNWRVSPGWWLTVLIGLPTPHRDSGPPHGRPAPLHRRPLIPRQPADASDRHAEPCGQ